MNQEVVSLVVAITGALAAIATFVTVNEMSKMRQLSVRPYVVPLSSKGTLLTIAFDNISSENIEERHQPIAIDEITSFGSIDLVNLGNGTAINIRIKLEFNLKDYIKYLIYESKLIKLVMTSPDLYHFYFKNNFVYYVRIPSNNWHSEVSFIEKSNNEREVFKKVLVPPDLITLFGILHQCIVYEERNVSKKLNMSSTKGRLEVSYSDIEYKTYVDEYEVEFGFVGAFFVRGEKNEFIQKKYQYYFSFDKKHEKSFSYSENSVIDNPKYWR